MPRNRLAQAEGRFEMVMLPEEGAAVKVPIGAELIQSPSERAGLPSLCYLPCES